MNPYLLHLSFNVFVYLFLGFALGASVGLALFFYSYLKSRIKMRSLEEDKELVHYEKRIVMDFLHNLIEGLGENINEEELFERIVRGSVRSTTALSACLFERRGQSLVRVASEGLFPPFKPLPKARLGETRVELMEKVLEGESFMMGEHLVGSVAASGKAVIIKDAARDPRFARARDEALRVYSIIVAPIVFSQEVLGVLAVANPIDGSNFNDADLSLIESFAEQAGLIIHNCSLLDMQREKQKIDFDLSMASHVQRMILPKDLPKLVGLDIASLYQPAQSLGGDLYNTFKLSEHGLAVAVADVSGKGIPASLLMSICRTNLHHLAPLIPSPKELLIRLNEEMIPNIRQSMFITLLYALVDTESDTLTFARAGHEKLFLLREGERHGRFIHAEGMAIGLVPNEIFSSKIEDVTLPFQKGDIAILYTDGITECINEQNHEFSSSRLASSVETMRRQSASSISEELFKHLKQFCGHRPFSDDLSLIALKRV